MFQNKSYEAINAGITGRSTKSTKSTLINAENAGILRIFGKLNLFKQEIKQQEKKTSK